MLWCAGSAGLMGAICPDSPGHYQGYTITKLSLAGPFDWIPAGRQNLRALKQDSDVAVDHRFDTVAWSSGADIIQDALHSIQPEMGQRLFLNVVLPQIENCNNSASTVEVVYRVFTNHFDWYTGQTFEARQQELANPAVTAAKESTSSRFVAQPFFSYDRSLRGFGGTRSQMRLTGGMFDTASLEVGGSSSGSLINFTLEGSRTNQKSFLQWKEWQLAYSHRDLAAAPAQLKQGQIGARFAAATRPLAGTLVFRFGAATQGGNAQSNAPIKLPADQLTNTRDQSAKLYLGVTQRGNRNSLTASGGVQLGSTGGANIDYVKEVVDVAYSARLLPFADSHKPWEIESRFNAGSFQQNGSMPFVQRFFGGNTVPNFISGDSWQLREGPVLRSIPAFRYNNGGMGGEKYFSLNLTTALGVKSRPVLPKELTGDPQFPKMLASELTSAERTLEKIYEAQLPEEKAVLGNLDPIAQALDAVKADLAEASQPGVLPAAARTTLADAKFQALLASSTIESVKKSQKVEQIPGVISSDSAPLVKLERGLASLENAMTTPASADLRQKMIDHGAVLERIRSQMAADSAGIQTEKAVEKAKNDMAPARAIIGTIQNEMNLWSVSPMLAFDMARMWPDPANRLRVAPGAGIRFNLVMVNFTIGYARNVFGLRQEGKGAVFFGLDITELFR